MDTNERRTLSRRETCARLGISLTTLHKEIQAGRLRALKLGKKVLIPVEAEAEEVTAFRRSMPECLPKK